jgi:hypothetical protein
MRWRRFRAIQQNTKKALTFLPSLYSIDGSIVGPWKKSLCLLCVKVYVPSWVLNSNLFATESWQIYTQAVLSFFKEFLCSLKGLIESFTTPSFTFFFGFGYIIFKTQVLFRMCLWIATINCSWRWWVTLSSLTSFFLWYRVSPSVTRFQVLSLPFLS